MQGEHPLRWAWPSILSAIVATGVGLFLASFQELFHAAPSLGGAAVLLRRPLEEVGRVMLEPLDSAVLFI